MIFMSEALIPTKKVCPRCGKTFECFHAKGCWCFEYTISPALTEKLRQEFNNCLCPDCLPLYATKNRENTNDN